jgi:hypothetical protein
MDETCFGKDERGVFTIWCVKLGKMGVPRINVSGFSGKLCKNGVHTDFHARPKMHQPMSWDVGGEMDS